MRIRLKVKNMLTYSTVLTMEEFRTDDSYVNEFINES